MVSKGKLTFLWILTFIMFLNIAISGYLWVQKNAALNGNSWLGDSCFADTSAGVGNCADVQLSSYGKIFNVSVPIWGVIAFSFMFVLVLIFTYSVKSGKPISSQNELETIRKIIAACLVIGSLGAVYFISLQFFVIHAICKYCMVIDSLTIISTISYLIIFKKSDLLNIQ